MKLRLLLTVAIILFSLVLGQASVASPAWAIYSPLSVANNRFGIHILDTSELERAAELVNSNGGTWGYVTVPIRANDRDLTKWEAFMEKCSKLKIIPILRIASFPNGEHWLAPNEWDLVDFANFLSELPWPIKNRYVIVYNEPNNKNEWGGFVYPEEYARVLSRAADIFHKNNQDYYVIGAGMDSSAPNGANSMNIYDYFMQMNEAVPGIFSQIDGMSYHSYGNPAFSTGPNAYSPVNIFGFRHEAEFLETRFFAKPTIFITEAGWQTDLLISGRAKDYYLYAFNNVWTDNVVAVTPFLLSASAGPFSGFSFTKPDGGFNDFAIAVKDLPKNQGKPQIAEYFKLPENSNVISNLPAVNWDISFPFNSIVNFFRIFFK